ncbi:MAG: energy transducer TonB [Nitrospirae bacterium]|nr:energy transducer TonB [Nitrospirota bacterium]
MLLVYLASEIKQGGSPPFFARIVTPDEIKDSGGAREKQKPALISPHQKTRKASQRPTTSTVTSPKTKQKNEKAAQKGIERVAPSTAYHKPQTPSDSALSQSGGGPSSPSAPTIQAEKGLGSGEKRGTDRELKSPQPQKTFKEKIFDKEIIGKLMVKERSKTDTPVTFDTKEYKYFGYMRRLRDKIENAWVYPQEAAERGIYGDLRIKFTIRKDGRLGSVELVRTSGHKSLDDAAIRALRSAEPYWPLPDEWGEDGLTITGQFIYSLYGTHLR